MGRVGHVGAEKSRVTTRNWREEEEEGQRGGGAGCVGREHHHPSLASQQGIGGMSRLCVFLLLPVLLGLASAIQFYLPVRSVKCLHEDIHNNVLVTGEYEVSEEPETTTNLKVRERVARVIYGKLSIDFSRQKCKINK